MTGRRAHWGRQVIDDIFSWHFIIAVFAVIGASLIQNTDLLNFFNIKPNLTLAVLITISFFMADWIGYLILVLLAGIFLRFQTGFDLINFAFAFIVLTLFSLVRKLPGQGLVNNIFLVFLGTVALYLIADFNFLYYYPITVLKELIYNIILGTAIFAITTELLTRR